MALRQMRIFSGMRFAGTKIKAAYTYRAIFLCLNFFKYLYSSKFCFLATCLGRRHKPRIVAYMVTITMKLKKLLHFCT